MEETEQLRAARAMRRAMLGDAYVDSATTDADPVAAEFQDYLTLTAWGVWARGGPLTPRDRSLLVMAMTAALGRMEEFRLHASSTARTGVTDEELDELARQILAVSPADRRTTHVVDTSTIGLGAAQAIAALLDKDGVAYVDAPVSGGVAGARARTLTVMYAAGDEACAHVEPVLAGLSDR